jgi:hypothetical protein
MRGAFRRSVGGLLLLAVAILAACGLRSAAEARAEAVLQRAGVSARAVRFSWLGPLQLTGLSRDLFGRSRVAVDSVDVGWRVLGGTDPRSHLSRVVLRGIRIERPPMVATWPEVDFDVVAWTADRIVLRQHDGGGEIEAHLARGDGERAVRVSGLDLGGADVRWSGDGVLRPGLWSGRATFAGTAARFESAGSLHADALRMTAPQALQPGGEGSPTAVDVAWHLRGGAGTIEIEDGAARLLGLDVSARGTVRGAPDGESTLNVKAQCDLAQAFRTAGLPPPLAELRGDHFGTATLDLSLQGPFHDPSSLVVDSRLRFAPEPEIARALAYLRGPFLHRPETSPGVVIDVRDGAPDFIAIDAVPPLFQRALLLSEDAGFWHHPGIDLAEIAAAWAENEEDGRRVRGGSTITQQLVKNVLLSSERTYGRKLKEAALSLMVDAVIPKARLLEIYVNVIQWGPRLHGLVPAARHYFGKAPAELSPKETAFLVCLIPNPVRYHQAHTQGRTGPGMEQLIRNLLAKLRTTGALSDEEYEAAVQEPLQFAPETPPAS